MRESGWECNEWRGSGGRGESEVAERVSVRGSESERGSVCICVCVRVYECVYVFERGKKREIES